MKGRISISVKILLLSFLNVFLLALVFAAFARVQYRLDLNSLLLSPGRDRIVAVSRLIALQLPNTDRKDWDRLLAGYTSTTHASACLFSSEGTQLAGPSVTVPETVLTTIRRDQGPRLVTGPPMPMPHTGSEPTRDDRGPLQEAPSEGYPEGGWESKGGAGSGGAQVNPEAMIVGDAGQSKVGPGAANANVAPWAIMPRGDWQFSTGHPPPPAMFPVFLIRAGAPISYWVGVHVPIFDRSMMRPDDATLLWTFPSLWTNSFFFDYAPWLVAALVVILVSAACWLPLIRDLTRSISQLTGATVAIAEGKLETRLSLRRRDELGQLSEAINLMAERLSGFVHGQRRFLSDVAHELCSPIARIQVSLGILDQRAQENQKHYVEGVQEEMEHMSDLVNELLLFSRAQLTASNTALTRVNLVDTVRRVLDREVGEGVHIETHLEDRTEVLARPEYLSRSIANIVRNAIRYAGKCGPIEISAQEKDGMVEITVADNGPGIPEAELEAVFKPFYRPEFARLRETGGVGLGLAIVRTCVEACGGVVQCRNRSPQGLEVEIKLSIARTFE
jgi:two-component system sensor histidine kinase CpxA